MLEIRKILFPTDFSDRAGAALPHAIRLAELHEAELHLLHVLVLHGPSAVEGMEVFPGEEEAREALEGAVRKAGEGSVVHSMTRSIAAAPAILDYAHERGIDLIVMGSHGRRGLRRLLLGSVTEEVLRASGCPVLTVHGPKEGAVSTAVTRILVPVDFSKRSSLAIDYGVELAETYGAKLHLLHVVELPTYPDFYVPVSMSGIDIPAVRQQSAERLKELALGPAARVDIETSVSVGRTVVEIVDTAESGGYDLIVMPSHGYSGIERALLGSVAEGVLRRAPCPVLIVKAEGKDLTPRA
ncbi:MAG: universal stress protein [Gemmatimonadota bacterium]